MTLTGLQSHLMFVIRHVPLRSCRDSRSPYPALPLLAADGALAVPGLTSAFLLDDFPKRTLVCSTEVSQVSDQPVFNLPCTIPTLWPDPFAVALWLGAPPVFLTERE